MRHCFGRFSSCSGFCPRRTSLNISATRKTPPWPSLSHPMFHENAFPPSLLFNLCHSHTAAFRSRLLQSQSFNLYLHSEPPTPSQVATPSSSLFTSVSCPPSENSTSSLSLPSTGDLLLFMLRSSQFYYSVSLPYMNSFVLPVIEVVLAAAPTTDPAETHREFFHFHLSPVAVLRCSFRCKKWMALTQRITSCLS